MLNAANDRFEQADAAATSPATVPFTPETSALQQILGLHISLARSRVYRHFSETFADLNLTQKQVAILWLIDEYAGISQIEIARFLQVDRSTMMQIVNRLQARDLLYRDAREGDRRSQALHLTHAGREILGEARAAIAAHEQWLKSRFTQAEIDTVVSLMGRIYED